MGDDSTDQPSQDDPSRQPAGGTGGSPSSPAATTNEQHAAEHRADQLSDADFMSVYAGRLSDDQALNAGSSTPRAQLGEEQPDPLLGTTLHDTYVVSRILGEGGMGRVYEAHHTRIVSKRYAIKVLHSEFSLNAEILLRFQREAEAAATIEHHGVVGTYDLGKTPQGWPYLVCEYLAGEDLNDFLKKRGALAPHTVVHIGKQLCSGLRAAHAHGVIHRDLKPHNIFVIQNHEPAQGQAGTSDAELPTVKVLDFGLSRFVEHENELTKTGIILGTPAYMAPEQAHGHETDLRTDIYGIGALLYTAATGQPPFKEETPQLTVLAVMNREPVRPRERVPSLPVDLEIVIQKAMARDPQQRYQSAGEMEAALAQLFGVSPSLNRRTRPSSQGIALAPRLTLSFYGLAALLLSGLSLACAVLALLEIKGINYAAFHPSLLEGLLFVLLGLVLLFPLGLLLRQFKRRTWNNSARVAELIPKIRRPLIAALLAYGVSALLLRLVWALAGVATGQLSQSVQGSSLVLYVILPANALLAASAVALEDAFHTTKNAFVRALTGVGFAAGALVAGLMLLVYALSSRQPSTEAPNRSAADTSVTVAVPLGSTQATEPQSSTDASATALGTAQVLPKSPIAPTDLAPAADLAIAVEDGAEALELLSKKYPRDSKVLKALVLARASRADTLDRSARAIGQLLEVDPAFRKDAEVLFILKKALRTQGPTYSAAALTVKHQMGPDGAELLYEVMSEHPEQRARLKGLFQELRKTKQASPAVQVAYDLRYTTTCKGRVPFLDQAEKHGDLRSLRQLQALSTAPKRCGWGQTCYPMCRAEAERFERSIKVISRRLAADQP